MKKLIAGLLLISFLFTVAGCSGVSQREYDTVVAERNQLQQRLAETLEILENVQAENDVLQDTAANTDIQPSRTNGEAQPINGGENMVYICESGGKYHTQSCRYAETSTDAIGVAVAESAGYEPCKHCFPQ